MTIPQVLYILARPGRARPGSYPIIRQNRLRPVLTTGREWPKIRERRRQSRRLTPATRTLRAPLSPEGRSEPGRGAVTSDPEYGQCQYGVGVPQGCTPEGYTPVVHHPRTWHWPTPGPTSPRPPRPGSERPSGLNAARRARPAGSRVQEAGSREQGSRKQGSREQEAGCRKQGSRNKARRACIITNKARRACVIPISP